MVKDCQGQRQPVGNPLRLPPDFSIATLAPSELWPGGLVKGLSTTGDVR
jgi:hypothetical protein